MQSVSSGQRRTRPKRARRAPSPVAVRYSCPRCGGDHPRPECGLAAQTSQALRGFGPDELRHLRQQALEEIASGLRGGAGREHLDGVLRLLDAVDARLAHDS